MKDDKLAAGVGMRIRKVRKEKLKRTQAEVAAELGISHGTISYWERGGNAKPANLREFAKLADVSMEFLINGNINRAVAEIFHPRWAELAERLAVRDDLDIIFDEFDYLIERRDQTIRDAIRQQQRRKTKKGRK